MIEKPQLNDKTKNFTIDLIDFSYDSSSLKENTFVEVTGEFSMGYWAQLGTYILPQIRIDEIRILE